MEKDTKQKANFAREILAFRKELAVKQIKVPERVHVLLMDTAESLYTEAYPNKPQEESE